MPIRERIANMIREAEMLGGMVALMAVWIALTRRFDFASLAVGIAAATLVLLVQRALLPPHEHLTGELGRRPIRFLLFLLTLAVRFVSSTLFTSRLILFGGEEGRMMALPTRVKHPVGRFLLLNSITLTPSTISLLVEDDLLYIHWLERKAGRGDWRAIKESLERRVAELFPTDLHRSRDADR
ncbi:Na+/H+ antiporter subunit E [Candidatus Bipolaricaulota bacterium]